MKKRLKEVIKTKGDRIKYNIYFNNSSNIIVIFFILDIFKIFCRYFKNNLSIFQKICRYFFVPTLIYSQIYICKQNIKRIKETYFFVDEIHLFNQLKIYVVK